MRSKHAVRVCVSMGIFILLLTYVRTSAYATRHGIMEFNVCVFASVGRASRRRESRRREPLVPLRAARSGPRRGWFWPPLRGVAKNLTLSTSQSRAPKSAESCNDPCTKHEVHQLMLPVSCLQAPAQPTTVRRASLLGRREREEKIVAPQPLNCWVSRRYTTHDATQSRCLSLSW